MCSLDICSSSVQFVTFVTLSGEWQVASIWYAASNSASSNGRFWKSPWRDKHLSAKPASRLYLFPTFTCRRVTHATCNTHPSGDESDPRSDHIVSGFAHGRATIRLPFVYRQKCRDLRTWYWLIVMPCTEQSPKTAMFRIGPPTPQPTSRTLLPGRTWLDF